MSPVREIWPGMTGPSSGSPPRRPGSVRRTTTIDICRPDGPSGDLVLVGHGRDLLTPTDGSDAVDVGRADTTVRIDFAGGRTVREVTVQRSDLPSLRRAVASLNGIGASSGFRDALDRAFGELSGTGSLTVQLLDETPVATLISGSSLARRLLAAAAEPGGGARPVPLGRRGTRRLPPIDVCAGWQAGGAIAMASLTAAPMLGEGPPAPSLDRGDDPIAWHDLPTLAIHDMRRRRRLDVVAVGDVLEIDAIFRDSLRAADGTETVVHEYGVTAQVGRSDLVVRRIAVVPRVLPGPDCPGAVPSAQRVVGHPVASLRALVAERFSGPSTCTHLNDELRSLADVPRLLEQLRLLD